MIVIYNNILYNNNRSHKNKFQKIIERLVIYISAILGHTCTPNVSPHVPVRTVVHIHVYEKHTICILKSGIQTKKDFITQSTWSQIIIAATQIGRASCRERVQISVVAVSLKKKIMELIGTSGCLLLYFNNLKP